MWEAWSLSKTYKVPASTLYSIKDEVTAWCFDRAVRLFGTSLEQEMEEAAQGAKNETMAQHRRQAVFARWTGTELKFRDPAAAGDGTTQASSEAAGSGPTRL